MIIIYLFIILLIFTNIKSLIRILRTNNFLKIDYKLNQTVCEKISIIIPVMNEVKLVEKSINYFKKLSNLCDVIYVTTSKEINMETYKKIKKEIINQNTDNILVINCPNKKGTMANQINYALKRIKNNKIIGLFNIDSEPDSKAFLYVINNINSNIVLQQISYFDDKMNGILNSAQHWQNRWSITYELGKYLSDFSLQFKYCIGHGLFFKKNIIKKIGYFSEKEINEDNEFGYRLLINNVKIKPIPFLEKADFALSKKIYIKQQSTWVNGPLYAFKYFRQNKKSIKNLIYSILNFKAFISWWLFPIISYLIFFVSLIVNIKLSFIIFLLIVFYVTIINYFSNTILIKRGYVKSNYNINPLSDLLFFLVHTFGCFITLYKVITNCNNINNKYNTEK